VPAREHDGLTVSDVMVRHTSDGTRPAHYVKTRDRNKGSACNLVTYDQDKESARSMDTQDQSKDATGKGRSRPHPSTQRNVLALLCIPEEDLSPAARAQRMLRVPPQFSASGNSTNTLTSKNADYFVVLNTIGEASVPSGTRRVDDHAFAKWSKFCDEMSVSP
jgi:hypothetical protein